jgi:hypothetical protein
MDKFVIRKTKNVSGTSENDVRSENNNENHSLNSEISDSTHVSKKQKLSHDTKRKFNTTF